MRKNSSKPKWLEVEGVGGEKILVRLSQVNFIRDNGDNTTRFYSNDVHLDAKTAFKDIEKVLSNGGEEEK
ncbi:hypothetical protein ACUIJQ_08315 [Levilactobacillus hammesii]|uniref:Uncharacterized protein n=1 Tax=Levilactobacillus hammesii DSM 16381 TaxID=1423753 RepID=A0A0R1UXB5_9LACO|nr:hypothetical protein [Levilactobacillus hammesii]KRL95554.1 hypothetical protein FD28_GL002525 [Levilactobacillus hammesii DSM 16381]